MTALLLLRITGVLISADPMTSTATHSSPRAKSSADLRAGKTHDTSTQLEDFLSSDDNDFVANHAKQTSNKWQACKKYTRKKLASAARARK